MKERPYNCFIDDRPGCMIVGFRSISVPLDNLCPSPPVILGVMHGSFSRSPCGTREGLGLTQYSFTLMRSRECSSWPSIGADIFSGGISKLLWCCHLSTWSMLFGTCKHCRFSCSYFVVALICLLRCMPYFTYHHKGSAASSPCRP